MKTRVIAVAILGLLLCVSRANAQICQYSCQLGASTVFTWNGSADSSQQLVTIDGYTTNQAIGFSGSIQIVNGNFLWLLDLPEPGVCSIARNPDGSCSGETYPGFPNNGFLDCETQITWGARQWGTRPDGSTMNGSQPGDYYSVTGATSCPLWNGTTSISVTPFHEFIQHRYCYRGVCRTSLVDTMLSGSGAAIVTQ